MYKLLAKNGQLFAFGLGLLLTLAFLGSVFSGLGSFSPDQYNSDIFNIGIMSAIGLTVICFIAMIVFGLVQIATNLKGSLQGLLGFGVVLAIFGISYATASVETGASWAALYKQFAITEGISKMVSAGITTCLALLGISIVAFVASEVLNVFK